MWCYKVSESDLWCCHGTGLELLIHPNMYKADHFLTHSVSFLHHTMRHVWRLWQCQEISTQHVSIKLIGMQAEWFLNTTEVHLNKHSPMFVFEPRYTVGKFFVHFFIFYFVVHLSLISGEFCDPEVWRIHSAALIRFQRSTAISLKTNLPF